MEQRSTRIGRNGYLEIVGSLRERLKSDEMIPGQFIATEKELQQEFGAGRSTIRKVLAELVEEGWAVNVPKKGVFVGRGIRSTQSNVVAFIENGSFVQTLLGERFELLASAEKLNVERIGRTADYPFSYALQRVLDGDYAGALIWGFAIDPDDTAVGQLTRSLPVVALDHKVGHSDTDLVRFDHERAGYELASHLIKQGCRRIGITGMLDTLETTIARIQGVMIACFENGLQPNPEDFQFISTSGDTSAKVGGLHNLLRQGNRPDGMVILHDFLAPSVVETALRCGLNLPNDLKLGMIGDDFAIDIDGLGMTAIRFDWNVLSEEAFALLKDRLADLQRPSVIRTLPFELVVRGLCGAVDNLSEPRNDLPLPQTFSYSNPWRVRTALPRSHRR